jgi:hypothetical protein
MTPEEFATKMKQISLMYDDYEYTHRAADRLLIDTLRALGYNEGCDVFDSIHKWYA